MPDAVNCRKNSNAARGVTSINSASEFGGNNRGPQHRKGHRQLEPGETLLLKF